MSYMNILQAILVIRLVVSPLQASEITIAIITYRKQMFYMNFIEFEL